MTPNPRPSDGELRILDFLWRHGPATVREVAADVFGDPSSTQYRAIQVQLDRLCNKELVIRDRTDTPHHFEAAIDRASFIGREIETMADKVSDGSVASLLMNLVRKVELTDEQRRELSRLLEEGDDE